MSHSTRFIM